MGQILSMGREQNKFVPLSDNFSQGHSGSPNGLLVKFESLYVFYANVYWCIFSAFFLNTQNLHTHKRKKRISFAIFWSMAYTNETWYLLIAQLYMYSAYLREKQL